MELLLWIGSFLLWAAIKMLATAAFAVPAGFGLAGGFHLFRKWKNDSYVKELEREKLAGAVT